MSGLGDELWQQEMLSKLSAKLRQMVDEIEEAIGRGGK
jgi:hypothetical protein